MYCLHCVEKRDKQEGKVVLLLRASYKRYMKLEKRVLKVEKPDINVYPIFANPLAIMQCHQETKEWILCNFIQLCSNSEALNFYDFNYKFCPYLKIQRISKEYLHTMNIDIIKFIINSISEGYYIYLLVKKSDIGAYKYESEDIRKQDNFAHDLLIYGYEINQQLFYIADNFVDGRYSFEKCTFEELETAIKNVEPKYEPRLGFKGNIELIEFYNKEPQGFNLKRVVDSFCDYISSKPTSMWNTLEFRNVYGEKKWYFGMECYDYILQQVNHMNTNNIYIQDFHLIWEHKKHLRRIISYMMGKAYITDKTLIKQVDNIEKDALIARNLVIKYGISGEEGIKEKIVKIYTKMVADEKKIMISLIRQVKESMEICYKTHG